MELDLNVHDGDKNYMSKMIIEVQDLVKNTVILKPLKGSVLKLRKEKYLVCWAPMVQVNQPHWRLWKLFVSKHRVRLQSMVFVWIKNRKKLNGSLECNCRLPVFTPV
jgi:hypothetical protein